MKKLIALLLCVCLLLSAAACTNAPAVGKSTDASNQDGEQRLRIVATLQSQQINFWSNVQHTLERLAKEENVDLTIMDLNGDVTTFANVIDDIVAMKPDGVITCGLETSTLGIHVKTLQDAGIPVVTYNISRRAQPARRSLQISRSSAASPVLRRQSTGKKITRIRRLSAVQSICIPRRSARNASTALWRLPHRLSRL